MKPSLSDTPLKALPWHVAMAVTATWFAWVIGLLIGGQHPAETHDTLVLKANSDASQCSTCEEAQP